MERKTALSGAAALGLAVAGGVSALFLTMGQGADASESPPTIVVTEYVDQFGNPVELRSATAASAEAMTEQLAVDTPVDEDAYEGEHAEDEEAYEEEHDDYEDDEHEDEDDYEDDEHEDDDYEDDEEEHDDYEDDEHEDEDDD